MVQVLGWGLLVASGVLLLARDTVIRRVTSQPLGSLPPGYAATKRGYANYAVLVAIVGLVTLGIGFSDAYLIIGSVAVFVILSVSAIYGEVVTYRKLKR